MTRQLVSTPLQPPAFDPHKLKYLRTDELDRLTEAWQAWYDAAPAGRARHRVRGRYVLTYLALRFTGARISEVLALDDRRDVDFRNARITLRTLKRKKRLWRTLPVPPVVTTELATYLAQYPGQVFGLRRSNFFTKMREIAGTAGLDPTQVSPHALRHSRAMEMVNVHVPLNIIQKLLGHASIFTTSLYLEVAGWDAELALRDRGLI